MDMKEIYKAEAEALRNCYKKTKEAVSELERTLEILKKGTLSEKEREALDSLLEYYAKSELEKTLRK